MPTHLSSASADIVAALHNLVSKTADSNRNILDTLTARHLAVATSLSTAVVIEALTALRSEGVIHTQGPVPNDPYATFAVGFDSGDPFAY